VAPHQRMLAVPRDATKGHRGVFPLISYLENRDQREEAARNPIKGSPGER
jgi:hypothetical protein